MYCVDLLGVVHKLHRTKGISSTHAPAAFLRGVMSRFLMPLVTRPLDPVLPTDVLELLCNEVRAVVGDDAVGDPKSVDD
jgi:hypothetical protein